MVFKNGSPEVPNLVNNLYQQANEVIKATCILNVSGLVKASKDEVFNRWWQLEIGWIKVNTNGICSNGGNAVAVGSVLWDWSSSWLKGFFHNLNNGGIISSEL